MDGWMILDICSSNLLSHESWTGDVAHMLSNMTSKKETQGKRKGPLSYININIGSRRKRKAIAHSLVRNAKNKQQSYRQITSSMVPFECNKSST
jgi:hypothetical protein